MYGITSGMAISQPDTSRNPVMPVSQATVTGQDADNGTKPAISRAEGVTIILLAAVSLRNLLF
jgi:hypothetical protein